MLGLLACAALAGCASTGPFVWYTQLPQAERAASSGEYVIGAGDVLSVRMYEQEALSSTVKVRADGRIAMPLIGEVNAAGQHPSSLARSLESSLSKFFVTPRVTVNVEQSQPVTITTIGEFKSVGVLTLEPSSSLIHAIGKAGGLTEFADENRIFVVRQTPAFRRIRFTYRAIMNDELGAASFALRTGDVVVAE